MMFPFRVYLSSTFQAPPQLPPGCEWLPTVYPDRSRNVLDSPLRPGLHAVTTNGYADPMVDDPKAQDELALYLLSNGVRDCVVDWEAPETPENAAVLRKLMKRLRGKGLSPDLYGYNETVLPLTRDIHVVWEPFSTDHDLFVRTRRRQLLEIRRRHNGRRVGGWVYTKFNLSGDGNPVPKGEYVGDDAFRLYLDKVFRHFDFVVWWPGMGAGGNWRRPDELPEGWDVYAEFATAAGGG